MRSSGAAESCQPARTAETVGDVLHLGFLFLDEDEEEEEDEDACTIAVTCRRRGCPRPRTGIIVHQADVLEP